MEKKLHYNIAILSLISFFQIFFELITYGVDITILACINVCMLGGLGVCREYIVSWAHGIILIYFSFFLWKSVFEILFSWYYFVVLPRQWRKWLWSKVCLNFYIQCVILFCMHQMGGRGLINQPSGKKKRGHVCVCGQTDCSARPQIAKTLSQLGQPRLEPGQAHS